MLLSVTISSVNAQSSDTGGATSMSSEQIYDNGEANNTTTTDGAKGTNDNSNAPMGEDGMYGSDRVAKEGFNMGWLGLLGLIGLFGLTGKRKSNSQV